METEESRGLKWKNSIARRILIYLISHPEAKDTIDGVKMWWLQNGFDQPREVDLRRVLDSLVERRWISVRTVSTAQNIYSLDKLKLTEIEEWLEKEHQYDEENDHVE